MSAPYTVQDLLNIRASSYLSGAGFVVLLYDHFITFDDEVQYIWNAKNSLPKVLFLINRYAVPGMMFFTTYVISSIGHPSLTDQRYDCKACAGFGMFIGVLSVANGNFVVLLRLWVLWERRAMLVFWTLGWFIVTQIGAFGMAAWAVVQMWPWLVYSPTLNMCVLAKRQKIGGLWVPGVVFEVMVFATACYNAFDRPRVGNRQLTNALYRDGVFYFVVLLTLRIANLTIAIASPLSLTFLGLFFIWCATTVTVSRLVLNLRRVTASMVDSRKDEQDEGDVRLGHLRVHKVTTVESSRPHTRNSVEPLHPQ